MAVDHWDDVRFFLAIAGEAGLSGAARALNVDHATVGRRLTSLEQRLGAKLFNRTPEGFVITSVGQAMLVQAEAMEGASVALERLASGHDTRSTGVVRVATVEILAYQVIVPAVAKLRQGAPGLQVGLVFRSRSVCIS